MAAPCKGSRSTDHPVLPSETAVSSVVGTILMVAVTVLVFSGLAFTVFNEASQAPDSQSARITITGQSDQSLVLIHEGGEAIQLTDGRLRLEADGTPATVELTNFAAQTADGNRWIIGESLCVVGSAAGCLHPPGTAITNLFVVVGNNSVATYGGDN